MALCLIMLVSPIPPPHKAAAVKPHTHIKSLAVTPPVTPQPQVVAQPETPPEQTVNPVEAPASVSAPAPSVSVVGCGSDPNMAYIYQHESGCRTDAVNPSSGAYGLCQALPGYKMASAGADWQTNWDTQNAWCVSYANQRYGSTYNAYLFWVANHWW